MPRSEDTDPRDPSDEALARFMDAWRDDVSTVPPRGLAEHVLAAVSGRQDEAERFQGLARRYAAAAAVLLAVGVGGSVTLAGTASPAGSPSSTADFSVVAGFGGLLDKHMSTVAYEVISELPNELPAGGR